MIYQIMLSIFLVSIGFTSYHLISGKDLMSIDWYEMLYLIMFSVVPQVIGRILRKFKKKQ